jgi:hypothetical protein
MLQNLPRGEPPGTDVMILKIFSPKKFAKKIGVFDSKKSCVNYAKF